MTGDNPQTAPGVGGGWQFKPNDGTPAQQRQPIPPSAPTPADAEPEPQAGPMRLAPSLDATPIAPATDPDEIVQWTASEFIAHHKNAAWYLGLIVAAAALAAIVFLLTRDKITVGMVVFAAIIFGIYAARKPRTLSYQLGRDGLVVGDKSYYYGQFRSFSVIAEGPFSSIVFMPLKRFMPMITVYYDPADEQKIVTMLADHLPMENRGMDLIDRFMHRIRF